MFSLNSWWMGWTSAYSKEHIQLNRTHLPSQLHSFPDLCTAFWQGSALLIQPFISLFNSSDFLKLPFDLLFSIWYFTAYAVQKQIH